MTKQAAARRSLRIGIALPQDVDEPIAAAGSLQRFARRAERLEFDGLWTQESVGGTARALEPLTALTFAAAVTTRPELGVATVLSLYRHPIQLARATASLDQLSRGRLVLGLALGDRRYDEAFAVPSDRRVRVFLDGVELLRRLWSEERVTASGLHWHLDGWAGGLRPTRPDGPPIWFGGHHPNALRRAVRLADGWMGAGGSSSAEFLNGLAMVREALDESPGRDRPFAIGKRVYLAVGRRRQANRDRLRGWFARRYNDPDRADRVAVVGEPAGVLDELGPLVEAGADYLLLNPLFDQARQLEVLAADVVPALRALLPVPDHAEPPGAPG